MSFKNSFKFTLHFVSKDFISSNDTGPISTGNHPKIGKVNMKHPNIRIAVVLQFQAMSRSQKVKLSDLENTTNFIGKRDKIRKHL